VSSNLEIGPRVHEQEAGKRVYVLLLQQKCDPGLFWPIQRVGCLPKRECDNLFPSCDLQRSICIVVLQPIKER